jgi:hypothetical protein
VASEAGAVRFSQLFGFWQTLSPQHMDEWQMRPFSLLIAWVQILLHSNCDGRYLALWGQSGTPLFMDAVLGLWGLPFFTQKEGGRGREGGGGGLLADF